VPALTLVSWGFLLVLLQPKSQLSTSAQHVGERILLAFTQAWPLVMACSCCCTALLRSQGMSLSTLKEISIAVWFGSDWKKYAQLTYQRSESNLDSWRIQELCALHGNFSWWQLSPLSEESGCCSKDMGCIAVTSAISPYSFVRFCLTSRNRD
jgi:hypothetical protein